MLHYRWYCLTATTAQMLEQTCISYNEVCNFYHSSRSWKYRDFFVKTRTKTKTFSSRPRPRSRPFFMSRGASRPRVRSRDYIPVNMPNFVPFWQPVCICCQTSVISLIAWPTNKQKNSKRYKSPHIMRRQQGNRRQQTSPPALLYHSAGRRGFGATVCKTVRPMLSDRCLSVCPVCLSGYDVGVLLSNGWMD